MNALRLAEVCQFLEALAPLPLAEDWDNVGLLAGDPDQTVRRIMTCLTITAASAAEAIQRSAELIVTHHPLPFRPVQRLTTTHTVGRLLWQLLGQSIAIYSPHTAWDSAAAGINQQLALGLGLQDVRPLRLLSTLGTTLGPGQGSGRAGELSPPLSLADVIKRTKAFLQLDQLQFVGDLAAEQRRIAIACGSAGSFVADAHQAGCTTLLTGETNFHTCLEAESLGMSLILPGHFASERFAQRTLAELLQANFPTIDVWASETEQDPVRWT